MNRKKDRYIYRHAEIGNNKEQCNLEDGLNLSERAVPILFFFYLAKPINEEEGWIRAMARLGRRCTLYNHCLKTMGSNFFKTTFWP